MQIITTLLAPVIDELSATDHTAAFWHAMHTVT